MSTATYTDTLILLAPSNRDGAFGQNTDAELADTNVEASLALLDAQCLAAVLAAFPGAEVRVEPLDGLLGFRVVTESDDEHEIWMDIVAILGHVFESGDWIVSSKGEEGE